MSKRKAEEKSEEDGEHQGSADKRARAIQQKHPGAETVFKNVPVLIFEEWLAKPHISKISTLNPQSEDGFVKRKWADIALMVYIYCKEELWGYIVVPSLSDACQASFKFNLTLVQNQFATGEEGLAFANTTMPSDWSINWFLVTDTPSAAAVVVPPSTVSSDPAMKESVVSEVVIPASTSISGDQTTIKYTVVANEKERPIVVRDVGKCEIKPVKDWMFVIFRGSMETFRHPFYLRSALAFNPMTKDVVISFEVCHIQAWGDCERDPRALRHICRLLTV